MGTCAIKRKNPLNHGGGPEMDHDQVAQSNKDHDYVNYRYDIGPLNKRSHSQRTETILELCNSSVPLQNRRSLY